ncbi:MAG: phosphate acyltransferase PlsX [Candidatus Humimicrobiia bacterium]
MSKKEIKKITIAIDAMGGDYAPEEIVEGAILSLEEKDFSIILVGEEEKINSLLSKQIFDKKRVSVLNATQKIEQDESPAIVVRRKKQSSINICSKLVRDKVADGMISAGPTGAVMTSAILNIGRIKGVKRPALAAFIPTVKNPILLIDIGANVDCKPIYLLQFAIMGKILYKNLLVDVQPKVGLLSIGEERTKGNHLVQESYELISKSIKDFVGNIEGHQILDGKAHVIVCDGFTGNVVIKSIEGTAEMLFNQLKDTFLTNTISKMGAYILKPSFKSLKKKFDYREYGGLQLVGIDGICIKAHGRSKSKAIKNSIRVAKQVINSEMIINLKSEISKYLKEDR